MAILASPTHSQPYYPPTGDGYCQKTNRGHACAHTAPHLYSRCCTGSLRSSSTVMRLGLSAGSVVARRMRSSARRKFCAHNNTHNIGQQDLSCQLYADVSRGRLAYHPWHSCQGNLLAYAWLPVLCASGHQQKQNIAKTRKSSHLVAQLHLRPLTPHLCQVIHVLVLHLRQYKKVQGSPQYNCQRQEKMGPGHSAL